MSIHRTLLISDLHVGSTVGLWPKKFGIEGGGDASPNKYQKWLLKCWALMLKEVASLDKPNLIVNGDPVQGVKDKDGQLITNRPDIQARAAIELLSLLRDLVRDVYFTRGSEYHEGRASEHVEMLAGALNCKVDPSTRQNTWPEILYAFGEGRKAPIAQVMHHIGKSSVPNYEATIPLRDVLTLKSEYDRVYGSEHPNIKMLIRSHRHRFIYVEAPPDIHALVTPAWQLKTAFSYKMPPLLPQIGYVIVEWDGCDIVVKDRIFKLPLPHIERIVDE